MKMGEGAWPRRRGGVGLTKEVKLLSGGRHKGLQGEDAWRWKGGRDTVDAEPHKNSSNGSGGQEPAIAGLLHNQ